MYTIVLTAPQIVNLQTRPETKLDLGGIALAYNCLFLRQVKTRYVCFSWYPALKFCQQSRRTGWLWNGGKRLIGFVKGYSNMQKFFFDTQRHFVLNVVPILDWLEKRFDKIILSYTSTSSLQHDC